MKNESSMNCAGALAGRRVRAALAAIICWATILSIFAQGAAPPNRGVVWAPTVPAPYRPNLKPKLEPMGPKAGGGAPQQLAVLPSLSADLLEELRQEDVHPFHQRLRIGVSRALDEPVVVNERTAPASAWRVLPDGWRVYSAQFLSEGALALRLHVEAAHLPDGARLVVYDPQRPEQSHQPTEAEDFTAENDLWLEPIAGESAILECEVPPGADTSEVFLTVAELAHRYRSAEASGIQPRAESCEIDATCYADQWGNQEGAVARILFIDDGSEYLCGGCLLNHLDTGTVADYFLTANHCINSQSAASSIVFYWLYQTTVCNDPNTAPDLSCTIPGGDDSNAPNVLFTEGATLLAHSSVNDFSFMKLKEAPPAGVYYAGWTTALPPIGNPGTILHFPGEPSDFCGQGSQDYERISFGVIVGTANLNYLNGGGNGADNVWEVQWNSGNVASNGVTEPGSSGGPLFDTNEFVIGQLYGGTSDCYTNASGLDVFGRFDVTYHSVEKWLGYSESLGGSTNGESNGGYSPGTYNGLFFNTNGAVPGSSGSISLTVSSSGHFTGKLALGANHYSFSGGANVSGTWTAAAGPKSNPLTVTFQYLGGSNEYGGTVSNAEWSASLSMAPVVYNAHTNPATFSPRYTLILPGDTNGGPVGDSYAAIQVHSSGLASLSGSLADGTSISASSDVLEGGQWPVYIPLYHNQGVLIGWLDFNTSTSTNPAPDISGTLSWVKPAGAPSKTYTAGITNQAIAAMGSSYTASASPLVNLGTNGVITFAGGSSNVMFFNSVTNSAKADRLGNASTNKLSLTLAASTGLFSGTVVIPGTRQSLSFHGALLQDTNAGYGYFLEGNVSGSVSLGVP